MEYILVIFIVTIIGVFIWFYISKIKRKPIKTQNNLSISNTNDITDLSSLVSVQNISSLTTIDESKLCEIKDTSIISRISNTLPAIVQGGANNFSKTAAKEVLNNPNLFIVIGKNGEKLNDATKKGVKYAMSKSGFGTLHDPNVSRALKAADAANTVANVMNIGSLVVGQYYMTEINNKLDDMCKSIDKISEFQEREFKSKILSLIDRVSNISRFSLEIMENNNIRNRYLQTLLDLEGIGIDLLKQVNVSINDIINKSPNPKYLEYEKLSEESFLLIQYQTALIQTLEEISKLSYLLNKGDQSMDMSGFLCNSNKEQSICIRNILQQWHNNQVELLKIDIEKNRISKSGIEKFIAQIPAILDENWNYKQLKDGLVQKININQEIETYTKQNDVYEQDVKLVVKDGKYYYLKD